ncbi:MAG: endonuclease/exonuclease/phosphatase family protein [Pirellulales bacterium]
MPTALLRAAFLWVFCCVGLVSAAEPAPRTLKIMTFNVENLAVPGAKTRLERYRFDIARAALFERVANVIEAMEPDVVNLLEVVSKESVDRLVKILHEKGLTKYQGYHIDNSDTFTGFDVCVLSKIPLEELDGASIRHFGMRGDHPYRGEYYSKDENGVVRQKTGGISRHALYFLTVDGHKLGFLGLHLKAQPDDPPSNAQCTHEMTIAQKIIQDEIVKRGYRPIVLGDFNDYDPDVPHRDETRNTMTGVLKGLKNFDAATPDDELVNAAAKILRREDRYTNWWDRNENGVQDPKDALTMLDHILLPKEFLPHIKRALIFHNNNDVSDHWPVYVEVDLPVVK